MKKYIKFISVILIAFLFIQCNEDEFFELERPQLFPWNSIGEFELSVHDSYFANFAASPAGGWFAIYGTSCYKNYLISDISRTSKHQPLEHYAIPDYHRDFDRMPHRIEGQSYSQLYRMLNQINPALEFVEGKEEAGEEVFPGMSDEDKETLKRQKGELYFMRAWTNYFLATVFNPPYNPGGDNSGEYIPLKMSFVESQEELRNAPLGSVQEFYDAILADLAKAKELLPDQNPHGKGRANKYAAATLLYRTKFLMGDHAGALAECDFIINDAVDGKGYYDLSEDPITTWNRNYGDTPAKEVIWEEEIRAGGGSNEIPFCWMTKIGYYRANNGGRGVNWKQGWAGTAAMSYYALDKIGWMDMSTNTPTSDALADKRYNQLYYFLLAGVDKPNTSEMTPEEKLNVDTLYDGRVTVTENHIWVDKYYRAADGRYSQVPLMRLPEIYLSRAMLRLSESNDVEGATKDINVIRARAGLDPVSTVTEESIEIERIKELAGEGGDRLLYLKGYRKTIDGGRINDEGVAVPAVAPPYSDMYVRVPLEETDYNGSYSN